MRGARIHTETGWLLFCNVHARHARNGFFVSRKLFDALRNVLMGPHDRNA